MYLKQVWRKVTVAEPHDGFCYSPSVHRYNIAVLLNQPLVVVFKHGHIIRIQRYAYTLCDI